MDWNAQAIIWLHSKSCLSDEQASVVRREYGFKGELLRVETRKAHVFFLSRRRGLGQQGERLKGGELNMNYT